MSAKRECLDHLALFGLESLRRAVACYKTFFNEYRPHQGLTNGVPARVADRAARIHGVGDRLPCTRPTCTEFLGGLLKSYSRKAA